MTGKVGNRSSRSRSGALDGIRGLAVLSVFLSHTSGRDMALAPWLQFHGIGHIGVLLFFVLSGFLLTRNLLGGQTTSQFYMRRFFRIVPLYFFVLMGVLIYQSTGRYSPEYLHISGGAESALLHFLFLKGDGVFWTMAAEFVFYLLLPPVVIAIGRLGIGWLVAATVLYFAWFYAIRVLGYSLPEPKVVDIAHPGQFLDVFICGILAAHVRRPLPKLIVALGFWGLLALTVAFVSANFLGAERPWFGLRWLSIVYGVVFAAGIASAAQGNRLIAGPAEIFILRFMGVVGFGWYLLHFAVLQVINLQTDLHPMVKFMSAFVLCALVSWVVFQTIERPGMRLGRQIERKLASVPS